MQLQHSFALVSNEADLQGCAKIPLEDIGAEIQRLTRDAAGPGSSIIVQPIHVEVVSSSGPTLTLIDLPGITWVNDAQKDIHDVIVGMIRRYIENPQMVILAVVSAVSDFGNSEALKLAKEVDPAQTRTIGVVTKIDTIQNDSDIVLKLRAERDTDIKLTLGWVSVRCRTPTEVKNGLSSRELLETEKLFFDTNPLLAGLEQQFWGTGTLVSRVVDIQGTTIDKWLPEVRSKIHEALFTRKNKLRQLPETCEDDNAKRLTYSKLVNKVMHVLDSTVRGEYLIYRGDKDMHIPPRMYEFFITFKETIEQDTQDFLSPGYTKVVEEQDAENHGIGLPNFLSDPVFRTLFSAEFERVVPRAVEYLLSNVRDYMLKVLSRFVTDGMVEFPRLAITVQGDVQRIVTEAHAAATKLLDAVLQSEINCVLTLDESGYERLLDEMREVAVKPLALPQETSTWGLGSRFETLLGIKKAKIAAIKNVQTNSPRIFHMQISLAAYSTLLHRQILDRVAKLCKLFFEVQLQQQVRDSLSGKGIDFIQSHMLQDPKIAQERRHVENSIKRLETCLQALESL